MIQKKTFDWEWLISTMSTMFDRITLLDKFLCNEQAFISIEKKISFKTFWSYLVSEHVFNLPKNVNIVVWSKMIQSDSLKPNFNFHGREDLRMSIVYDAL